MEPRIPEAGDQVVVTDEYAHDGTSTIIGVLKPGEADSPVFVLAIPGVVRDYSKPLQFSPYARRGRWSWPEEGVKYNEPRRGPVAVNVPPRR